MTSFTANDVPEQTGKTVFITGANTGIGYQTAKVLAARGARVLIGCRSKDKAENACKQIRADHPEAELQPVSLDLGDLASVKKAAKRVAQEPRLDLLINNAGIMIPPYELTRDGFESQFGVNHLGHFALTGLLLDKLRETPSARVVTVSSIAHRQGRILFDDINAENGYNAMVRYAQSKLANLCFAYELQRRLVAAGDDTLSVAAHPGIADTELARYIPRAMMLFYPLFRPLFNTSAQGAWPTLFAATGESVRGGDYYGPGRLRETSGPAVKVASSRRSQDTDLARKLWDLSIEMTGVDPGI
jgi:NAD(P)-dependent dehydrogenase (short-subunit alcohol dehydrogenase family)